MWNMKSVNVKDSNVFFCVETGICVREDLYAPIQAEFSIEQSSRPNGTPEIYNVSLANPTHPLVNKCLC